jgi:hypothetical protein
MNNHILGSLITNYEHHIPTIELPDINDRHVAAASIEAQANVIVTLNLRDVPDTALAPYDIKAVHPDDFVQALLAEDEEAVCAVVRKQRFDLKNPPQPVEQLLATLEAQGLFNTVKRLRQFTSSL